MWPGQLYTSNAVTVIFEWNEVRLTMRGIVCCIPRRVRNMVVWTLVAASLILAALVWHSLGRVLRPIG